MVETDGILVFAICYLLSKRPVAREPLIRAGVLIFSDVFRAELGEDSRSHLFRPSPFMKVSLLQVKVCIESVGICKAWADAGA